MSGGGGCGGAEHARSFPCDKGTICGKEREGGGGRAGGPEAERWRCGGNPAVAAVNQPA